MRDPRTRSGARAAARRLLAAVLAALPGCSPGDAKRPDVVLVSIDTLRADRVGCYGAGRNTSPNLDRLAAEGGLFAAAFAPTSWTLPSHVSLLTGMDILAHQVIEMSDRIDGRRRTLAQDLADQGYRTAGFVSAPFLHTAYGFDRGFETYENFGVDSVEIAFPPTQDEHRASHADDTAARVIDAAISWLTAAPVGAAPPIFLFVHLWDPHYDYAPPAPYDRLFDPDYGGDLEVREYEKRVEINAAMPTRDLQHLRALYDGEVRWTDSQIQRLVEALGRRGRLDSTVLAVVSDHGEEFFEHGRRGHSHTLFEESVRVPWILRYPPRIDPGTVVATPVSLADVAPTLLDLAGLEPLAEATGRSQVPELNGQKRPERPVLMHVKQRFALRGSDWKVILEGDDARYFDLRADPNEMAGKAAAEVAPERLAELRRRIADDRAVAARLPWGRRAKVELDAATRERLRVLGYVND